jgi:hypothetical protein
MADDDLSDTDDNASKPSWSIDSPDYRNDEFPSWRSLLDLLNYQPLFCYSLKGDSNEYGAPVRLPGDKLIPDPDSPTGFLMSPSGAANLAKVAEAGRALGERYRLIDYVSDNPLEAFAFLTVALGTNLGHAGTFDYQREGSWLEGYRQHPLFRDISNVNVGVFGQQFGLSKEELLFISGKFARIKSSNADPSQPYSLDAKTREWIEVGYGIGASGIFGQPRIP